MSVAPETIIYLLVAALAGYLLGAIPFGVIVARLFGSDDPRTYGSTHIGATNVFRSGGAVPALIAFAGDAGKGMASVWIGATLAGQVGLVVAGTLAVVGHCYSVYIGWDGGMGMATAAGLLAWISPPVFIVEIFVLLALYYLLRDRYLTAILGVPAVPVALQSVDAPFSHVLLSLLVAAFLVWRFWSQRTA